MSECQLNTTTLMIPYSEYVAMANEFLIRFTTDTGNFTSYQTLAVDYESLMALKSEIQVPEDCANYITGIRIAYGLGNDQNMVLYFIGLYGVLINEEGGNGYFELSEEAPGKPRPPKHPKPPKRIAVIKNSNYNFYACMDGVLINIINDPVAMDLALEHLNNYKSSIRFVKLNGEEERWTIKDVRSVFYPFQEIEALYNEYGGDTIYFTSVAEYFDDEIKHCVALSTAPPEQSQLLGIVAGNYGSMCPPTCSVVVLPLQ